MPVSTFDMMMQGILMSARPAPVSSGIAYVGGDSGDISGGNSIALSLATAGAGAGHDAFVFAFGDNELATISLTGVTGWTEIVQEQTPSGRAMRAAIYHKRLGASEPDPTVQTDDDDQWGAVLAVFDGVHASNPFDIAAQYVRSDTVNTYAMTPAGFTTQTDEAAALIFGCITHSDIASWAAPTGMTLGQTTRNTHRNVGVAYQTDLGTAGAKTFAAWQNTGSGFTSDFTSYAIALRKA